MSGISNLSPSELDEHFLRRSFEVARRAITHGNHPFGAILVDREPQRADRGRERLHARRMTAPPMPSACWRRRPARRSSADVLRQATLYSSAEPCAMCAGAIYWAGIGRLVYGLSEHRLRAVTGNHPENPTLDLPCREVFESGQRPTEVIGPLLEDEAEALHAGVWNK